MAKNKNPIFKKLVAEVAPEIKEKLDQVAQLREQEAQKHKNIERMHQHKLSLEEGLTHFNEQAGKALASGEDPLPWLEKAAHASRQIQSLEDFLPSTNSDLGSIEKQEVKNLLLEVSRETKTIVHNSETKARAQADLDAALGEVKRIVDEWRSCVDDLFECYGLPKGDWLEQSMRKRQFQASDAHLRRWAREYFL